MFQPPPGLSARNPGKALAKISTSPSLIFRTSRFNFLSLRTSSSSTLQRASSDHKRPSSTTTYTHSSPPLQQWRTKRARSSICKPAPPPIPTSTNTFFQLRPPQMQRNKPHHQSQRPRLSPNIRGESRRERPIYRRESGVCAVWVRKVEGGER
jgi:hypothetical protein